MPARSLFVPLLVLGAGCGEGDDDDDVTVPCVSDADCGDGLCLPAPAPAHCAPACSDEQDCGEGLSCAPVLHGGAVRWGCRPAGAGGLVPGAACATGDDCESTLCHESLCVEACGACEVGESCDPVTLGEADLEVEQGVCRPLPASPDLEVGPFETTANGSDEISIEVPDDVRSFVITMIDEEGTRIGARSLVSPGGTTLLDLHDEAVDLNPGFVYPGTGSVLVPSTDAAAARPAAGTYRLRVGTYDPADFENLVPVAGSVERIVVVFERTGEEGGVLDLELHWSPATGITAATAASSPLVTEILDQASAILGRNAPVRLGSVGHHDLAADHDVVEDGNEARSICRESSAPGPAGSAVNVFVVQDLTFTAGFGGGIPGPPGIFGTTASGIVVEVQGSGRDTGILVAHELGHFLGLGHTTEINGRHDAISDTPECPGDTFIENCPDYSNLMFPIFPLWVGLSLTPGQRSVLRGWPGLHEVVRSAACPAAGKTIDVTGTGGTGGDSSVLTDSFQGSCGGAGAPERAHLVRPVAGLTALEVHASGVDFAPVVHVRRHSCAEPAAEVACVSGDAATDVTVTIPAPEPDGYFVFVDGRDGTGGSFSLEVLAIP